MRPDELVDLEKKFRHARVRKGSFFPILTTKPADER